MSLATKTRRVILRVILAPKDWGWSPLSTSSNPVCATLPTVASSSSQRLAQHFWWEWQPLSMRRPIGSGHQMRHAVFLRWPTQFRFRETNWGTVPRTDSQLVLHLGFSVGGWCGRKQTSVDDHESLAQALGVSPACLAFGGTLGDSQQASSSNTDDTQDIAIDCKPLAQAIGVPACLSRSSRSSMSSTDRA